jgi:alpha-beta hydrolase superfamily lysophospholipase
LPEKNHLFSFMMNNLSRILSFEIPTGDDYPIRADLYPPSPQSAPAVVILCHGFKGYRRWGFLPDLALGLSQAGIAAVSMDFSMNGRSRNFSSDTDRRAPFSHPEVFSKNTIRRELEDLAAMIRVIENTRLDGRLAPDAPIGLFGHSRGALISLVTALEHDNIRAICTWSTPADANFFTPEQKRKWRQEGVYAFTDARDGLALAIDIGYLDDLENNAERYQVAGRISGLGIPHLMVHGSQDLVVAPASAEMIFEAAGRPKNSRVLTVTTGHTFGFTESPGQPAAAFETARDETVRWFKNYL